MLAYPPKLGTPASGSCRETRVFHTPRVLGIGSQVAPIVLEDVQGGHVHGVGAGHYVLPGLLIVMNALVQHPQEQTDRHVAIIRPMTNEIARAKRVVDVQPIIAADELIEQRWAHSAYLPLATPLITNILLLIRNVKKR